MEADAAETFDACRSKWRASRRIDTTPGKSSSGDLRSPISCAVWLISRARPANRRRQCRSMSPAASTRHSRAHGAPRAHRRRDAYRQSVRSVLLTPPGWPRSRRVTEGKGHLFTIETELFLCSSVTTSNHLEPDPKVCCVRCGVVIPGYGAHRDGERRCGRRSTVGSIGGRATVIRAI
jgi:hypothetical protein